MNTLVGRTDWEKMNKLKKGEEWYIRYVGRVLRGIVKLSWGMPTGMGWWWREC